MSSTNYMIVNPWQKVYLAVTDATPAAGSLVHMLPIQTPETATVSAFWTITEVLGGYTINLTSNSSLCLDINAIPPNNPVPGTSLVLSNTSTPNFFNSNLWVVGQLGAPTLGTPNQIESATLAGDYVIDAGAQPNSQIYPDRNNGNQMWQLLSVQ